MPFKFNPLTGNLDLVRSGISKIQQFDSDPSSPIAEQAWVKKYVSGVIPAALVHTVLQYGLTLAENTYLYGYDLSYRTEEGTTVRVTLT